jgi:hypothetical protein
MGLEVLGWDYDKFISENLKCECVFMIKVPKGNDLFLKDCEGQLLFFIYYIIIVVVDYCMPINKMISR